MEDNIENKEQEQVETWMDKDQCKRLQERWGDYDDFAVKEGKKEIVDALHDLMDKFHPNAKPVVLDVGCGAGHFLWQLRNRKVKGLVGIDISPHMIALCKEQFKQSPKTKTQFKVASCWDIPYKSNAVSLVINIDVNMHIGGSWKAIKEMLRVSNKYVFFTGPSFEKQPEMDVQKTRQIWAVSRILLGQKLDKLKKKKEIKDYYYVDRTGTATYKHRILIIEK